MSSKISVKPKKSSPISAQKMAPPAPSRTARTADGGFVQVDGEPFYRLANYDRLPAFFMSVVSAEDHWMFLSSHGGLTAGRGDADHAIFPYYTDDKICDHAESTGGKTIVRVRRGGRDRVWEPFSARGEGRFRICRSLLKSVWGNEVWFEEENRDLGLVFRAGWSNSRRFGWIRRGSLTNGGRVPVRLALVDGLQNIMPSGIGSDFQLRYSTLLDAYKRSELLPGGRLALFRLSSVPSDRPEPAESLEATAVWSLGLGRARVLLSSGQLEAFRHGKVVRREADVRGRRGAYFLQGEKTLAAGRTIDWMIGADVAQSAADVVLLGKKLERPAVFRREVLADIKEGTEELRRIVGSADGLQFSALPMGSARHYSNTLCNAMRGGVFPDGERITKTDLDRFDRSSSPAVLPRWRRWVGKLPPVISYPDLVRAARDSGDSCIERICREYLPLTFSRRHGDPSRPWNRFTIPSRDEAGRRVLNYEGNWRDIFQNWEALAQSFPGYTPGMVARFLNASTIDGYNPYRITRDGPDWEVPEPHDPWACIGYWGDHQIIYLLKLLEHTTRHDPRELEDLLDRDVFAYANVPYRIRDYRSLVADPKNTVAFDEHLEKVIRSRVRHRGAEGKLLWDAKGRVVRANLTEKLLVPLLAKLSNFVPGAGIWLNTQRPEWNDANNALVGQGASVVTLAYLRRYVAFLHSLFAASPRLAVPVSRELASFLKAVAGALAKHRGILSRKTMADRDRRLLVDLLGRAGETYRRAVYGRGLSAGKVSVPLAEILRFLDSALSWTDHSLRLNRRSDGLWHSYNLIAFEGESRLCVRPLYEMLEGQVAIMSCGLLTPAEVVSLLRSLRRSAMYRPDQHSYLLYPDRRLPGFLERNNLPPRAVCNSRLLRKLLADGDSRLVEKDTRGRVHFRPGIGNQRALAGVLDVLAKLPGYADLVRRERATIGRIYEDLFDHQSFTGRSGTFYGYEGLGCIYWHMVSKLLLAVQENCFQAERGKVPKPVRRALTAAYYDIRRGLGDSKTPHEYGAMPMDPYSHTPARGGAKQPGLTGQVKEDILCRRGELGVFVEAGSIRIRPSLLRRNEFVREPATFVCLDSMGRQTSLNLPAFSLAFTVCQTPFIYRLGPEDALTICHSDGSRQVSADLGLDRAASEAIFRRNGSVEQVMVQLGRHWFADEPA